MRMGGKGQFDIPIDFIIGRPGKGDLHCLSPKLPLHLRRFHDFHKGRSCQQGIVSKMLCDTVILRPFII